MELRVYINNELLNDIPNGLDSFAKEFVLDPDLFGIYAVSTFDLVFVGDGYCKLKELFENVETCSIDIIIQQKCNKAWKNIFVGIIEVGSIKINESEVSATCEVQDNSPLALISRNAEVTIDLETTKDIFDGTITPITFYNKLFYSPNNATPYDRKYVLWDDAFKTVLTCITGKTVNVISNYMQATPTECEWLVTLTGDMAQLSKITITYKDFQGNTLTAETGFPFTPALTGNDLLTGIRYEMVTQFPYSVPPYTDADVRNFIQYGVDYRDFTFTSQNNATKQITLKCTLPIEIISASIVSTDVTATISFTKVSDYIDGGGSPILTNYRLLANQDSPYLFNVSFKTLIEEFNKIYSVYFTAKYNSSGEIDFTIENADTFLNGAINITFDDAKDLTSEFNEDLKSDIELNEPDKTTLATLERTLTNEACIKQNTLDNKCEFILGANRIWNDLTIAFDDNYENSIYVIGGGGDTYGIQFIRERWPSLTNLYTIEVYNAFLTNYHRIYRHFGSFKGNLLGTSKVLRQNANLNIENISEIKLYKAYNFNEVMTSDEFDALTDNIIDKAQFKKTNDTTYREGIITSVRYNYNSGEAEITILGR